MRKKVIWHFGCCFFIAALLSPSCIKGQGITTQSSVNNPNVNYNNDPRTTFADIQEVLRITESLITLRLKGSPQSRAALSKNQQEDNCDDPIFETTEVTRRSKIKRITAPAYTEEARAKRVEGTVILTAVFCRNGKVTDISVIQALPHGLTENTIETTRQIEFAPAEKNGETVSQRFRRECTFRLF